MATVTFKTFDDDEGQFLGRARLPRVPSKGERVVLRGKEFGDESDDGTQFRVHSVEWQVDMDGGEGNAEVWLRLPAADATFMPRCACAPERQVADPAHHREGRCDDCGMRVAVRSF